MTKERSSTLQIGYTERSEHTPLHLSYTTSPTTSSSSSTSTSSSLDPPTTYTSNVQDNDVLTDTYTNPHTHGRTVEKDDIDPEYVCVMPISELGVLMSILYRIQNILVLNSSHFEELTLRLLQVM